MSILRPTYHKVISNSSYLSGIAQPDLFEMHNSHKLPMGPPRFWGGHRGIKTARPGEKKVLVFCICLIMCSIHSYFVCILQLCNCMPALNWLYRTKPHEPMLPYPDINYHTKCVVFPSDTNLGAEWSGLDILRTTAWSYSLNHFISCFFLKMNTSIWKQWTDSDTIKS